MQLLNCTLALLGTPAATHNELSMEVELQSLGTWHDLTLALMQGTVAYWVKLETKAKGSTLRQKLLAFSSAHPRKPPGSWAWAASAPRSSGAARTRADSVHCGDLA